MTAPSGAQSDSPEARQYNRIHRRLSVIDLALGFAALIVLLVTGWTTGLRDVAYRGAGGADLYSLAVFFYVGMLMLLTRVIGLPLDYYSFRLEHRFQLSNQKFRSWVWDEVKGFLVSLVLATIVVELIYWTIGVSREWWWVIAWAVFVLLTVVLAQLAPVILFPIFYKFEPLENDDLVQRLVDLSRRAGTRVRGVYEWKLSEKSKKANAALTGLGATRRIILADTLLNQYSGDEIEAILAHELGHHVHRHMMKGLLLQMAISFVGFWAAAAVLEYAVLRHQVLGIQQLNDFAALPLLVLVSTVLSLLLAPALNAFSRHNERQADHYALVSIPAVAPFISSMEKLAQQNLAERNPSRWVEVLFHSHPPIAKRVAAAEEFARAHQ